MTERAHSAWGPSAAKRWINCPGSIQATKDLPDSDSEFSIEGTACHTLSEWCREQNKPAAHWLSKYVNVQLVDGSTRAVKITQNLADAVQDFVDFCNALGGEQLIEVKVRYEEYVKGGYGRLDHAALHPGFAHIVDLKAGAGVKVYAEHNEQLMLYALGVLIEHDWLYDFQKFLLTVHQPRLDWVDTWEISREDLLRWAANTLPSAYKATLIPEPKFQPGEWCRWCKISGKCRAQAKQKFQTAMDDFVDLNAVGKVKKSATLTNDELYALRPHLKAIKEFAESCNSRITAELRAGRKVGDLKLVAGRSERQFIGDNDTVVAELDLAGVDTAQCFTKPVLMSVAKIEEIVGKPRFKEPGKKKEAGDLYRLIRKVSGTPVIAEGDDPRPALTVDLLTEFSDLTKESEE